MISKNDITGDLICSKQNSDLYRSGWDRIFRRKKMSDPMIVEIKQMPNEDELFLEFPPALLEKLGWVEGDTLIWEITENQEIILTKKE